MKFIYVGEVIDQLLIDPNLWENPYVKLVLRMMAWETYMYHMSRPVGQRSYSMISKWLSVGRGEYLPHDIKEYAVSSSMEILLAYVIIKSSDPQAPLSIHIGTYQDDNTHINMWYIQGTPTTNLTRGEMSYIGTDPIDQITIVSKLHEEDLMGGSLTMDDDPICTASELFKYEIRYRYNRNGNSIVLPGSKGQIMKWLASEGVCNDDNVRNTSHAIDSILSSGSNFAHEIPEMNVWPQKGEDEHLYNILLSRCVLKTKVIKGTDHIFDRYPPGGCVVPINTFDS